MIKRLVGPPIKAPFTLGKIYSDKLQNLVNICPYYFDSFRRNMELGSIRMKINTQKKVDK